MKFDFSNLSVIEVPVIGPDGQKYVLKEATAKVAKEFNNARISGVVLGPTGKPQRLESIGELESLLVSLCLFHEDGRPVLRQQIEKWPAKVVKSLFDEAKRISGLDEGLDFVKESLSFVLFHENSPIAFEDFYQFVKTCNDNRIASGAPDMSAFLEMLDDIRTSKTNPTK
ncbi:MAG: hypothetical protein QXI61_06605 [Nitrososphaerota archaeon]